MTPTVIISRATGRSTIGQRAFTEIATPRYIIVTERYCGLRENLNGP